MVKTGVFSLLLFCSFCVAKPLGNIKPFYISDQGIGIDAQSIAVRDLWYLFGHVCDLDVIIPLSIKGRVSVHAKPQQCQDLEALLLSLGPWHGGHQDHRLTLSLMKEHQEHRVVEITHKTSDQISKKLNKLIPAKSRFIIDDHHIMLIGQSNEIDRYESLIHDCDYHEKVVKLMMMMVWITEEALEELGIDWQQMDHIILKQSWIELLGLFRDWSSEGRANILSHDELLITLGETGHINHSHEHTFIEQGSIFHHSVALPNLFNWSVKPLSYHNGLLDTQQKIDLSWVQQGQSLPHQNTLKVDQLIPIKQQKATLLAHHQWVMDHNTKSCGWLPWCFNDYKHQQQFFVIFGSFAHVDH